MARLEVNRSGEMEVFVRVVEQGSFSAAARTLGMTPSAVSKLIVRLEERLAVRLLNRSTRQIKLTSEGCVFYESSIRVLGDLAEAESVVAAKDVPHGRLCINTSISFGKHLLLPLIPEFLERYPEVKLDITMTDEVVDLLEKRVDVAIRAGPLKNSRLVARKLGRIRLVIVGSPDYIERYGMPMIPTDLKQHNLISFNHERVLNSWLFLDNGQPLTISANGNIQVSDGDILHQLALSGVGLARLAFFQVKADLATGRLIPVLESFSVNEQKDVHAIYVGQGAHLPARIRVLLDFLVEKINFN